MSMPYTDNSLTLRTVFGVTLLGRVVGLLKPLNVQMLYWWVDELMLNISLWVLSLDD